MSLKQNLHGFIETYHPRLMVRGDASMSAAYLKGVLHGIWDMAESNVQNARRNYFAIAALAFAGDMYAFGGSLHMARVGLTAGELSALILLGTKIYVTRHAGMHQYRDEDLGITDPNAPEDSVVYDRAAKDVQRRLPPRNPSANHFNKII